MSRWTPDRSAILSLLLDEVTGTQEAIDIRQDYCRLSDSIMSYNNLLPYRQYYSGSKAEGLDLPGSDDDVMQDINNLLNIKVVQSFNEISDTPIYEEFLLCTENMNQGFALLRRIRQNAKIRSPMLNAAIEMINGEQYLSSNRLVSKALQIIRIIQSVFTGTRQGPSMELNLPHQDPSVPGMDAVLCIHCGFWPNDATEWVRRPRYFGWPTSHDISSIVDFGCHLVAVGHPNSDTKVSEWRLSFSIAEKTLVWSFNHIQMQCYAFLKIILKQFIKLKCSPPNRILCSYFIKTFLFWKYETTHLDFWCERNLKDCLMYLLKEFSQCIHEGVIRHYFLPRFNLLSIKLTPEAQTELLHLFDIVIQCDINILTECEALQNVWSKFLSANKNQMNVVNNARKTNLLQTDMLMMKSLIRVIDIFFIDTPDFRGNVVDELRSHFSKVWPHLFPHIDQKSMLPFLHLAFPLLRSDFISQQPSTADRIRIQILNLSCKTSLKLLLLKYLYSFTYIESIFSLPRLQGNKYLFKLQRITNDNTSFDISSSKLWYAIVLLKKCDYVSALSIINHVISSIPTYAMNNSETEIFNSERKRLYVDTFQNSSCTITQRARKAWLIDLMFTKKMSEILPLAIQIELYFCTNGSNRVSAYRAVKLSPYTCSYYLMFQCYHELGQYGNRDHALCQLIDIVNNRERCGQWRHHSYNIAGHCLLITGQIDRARDMFNRSRRVTYEKPLPNECNAASWYIRNFCSVSC